ncbi:hypothetical protein ACF06X_33300 [Streptomyces sp. NPDC015346]|uniref:hypothetical protein n=1 Tax=Streptomyces sp. NPDC015346 TaxID=3364954 RepID=UPI0036F4D370
MAAQLNSTVYVQDPDTHQTVELAPGTTPEPRLAALVTNPAAWVDGKLPRLRTQAKAETPEGDGKTPSGDDPDAASGDGSGTDSGDDDPTDPDANPDEVSSQQAAPVVEEKKPAARTAAKKTATRKQAETAAEGTGGQ